MADLAAGRWSMWHGLNPWPSVVDVARSFGVSELPEENSGTFAGSPTMFHSYELESAAVTAWFEDDSVVAIVIEDPVAEPGDAWDAAPDLVLESAVGSQFEQRVYASRGLILHVVAATGDEDLDEWADDDWSDLEDSGDGADEDGEDVEGAESNAAESDVVLLIAVAPFDPAEFASDPLHHYGRVRRMGRRR